MKEIPLSQGKFAFVNDEDFAELSKFKWCADKDGYAKRNVPHPTIEGRRIRVMMHRQLMGLAYGDGLCVDHIDGNTLNNCRSNLRIATNAQNQRNVGAKCSNKSGYKGVSWSSRDKKWYAHIQYNGERTYLGCFDDPELASLAYQVAASELHGEFANFGSIGS